jgi:hypothetical protein
MTGITKDEEMPNNHDVTLMYAPGSFQATPPSIRVHPGDTINFHLAPNSMFGTIRIRFRDRHFFSTPRAQFATDGIFHQGDGNVHVANALSAGTTYHCELLDASGAVISQSTETGGEILPAS